jgi:hypothetical protein
MNAARLSPDLPFASTVIGDTSQLREVQHRAIHGGTTMAKYLFVYHGGSAPTDPDSVKKVMDAWGNWFGSMGSAVIDGGNPVGKSYTVKSDGGLSNEGGANPASGYSLVEASSVEDAHKKAKGCPILQAGGTIEIAQCMDM